MTTKEDIQRMINTAEDNGFERGLEQGRRTGKEEVARKLLERGFSVSDVAEMTGLSEEALQKL